MKIIKFAIYNYNFLRIIEPNKQLQMEFPDWQVVDVEESFRNRQQVLGDILQSDFHAPYQFCECQEEGILAPTGGEAAGRGVRYACGEHHERDHYRRAF